tara:strand:+ start:1092 stop:1826 length:735 start_codon:yes stop_codon:yes gene_type:complete
MFKKKIYIPDSKIPFKLSRTKIDLYFECKRCFFLDQKLGIKRPHGAPLVLNNKIVNDFKNELNFCRTEKKSHPEIIKIKKSFVPIQHSKIDDWKNSFKGVGFYHKETNFFIYGIIDDVWKDLNTNLNHSVIIKTTSRSDELSFDNIWSGYWRQLSLYSFLLSKNLLSMSKTGLLIYINLPKNLKNSDKETTYTLNLFEKILDFNWIEVTLREIYSTLNQSKPPMNSRRCKYCNYYFNIKNMTNE